jgi:hypothetical protein
VIDLENCIKPKVLPDLLIIKDFLNDQRIGQQEGLMGQPVMYL